MKLCLALVISTALHVTAATDLELLRDGASAYQIVVPNKLPTPTLTGCLAQTARLLQTAFKANGADVPVVTEDQLEAGKRAIYLGNTAFAKQHDVEASKLLDWSYVQRVVGKDLIIAGNDQPSPVAEEAQKKKQPALDRVGTVKAAADFAREFMGVRFLYPEIGSYVPVSTAEKIDLLASPAIEFMPLRSMTVPADLNVQKTPLIRINTAHPAGASFYDLALNRFPKIDEMFGSHTWERAVPPAKYGEAHPEYFAMVNGQRIKPEGGKTQYCLSNPEVQEFIYQDIVKHYDEGFASVDLGQPDGFQPCQCENCAKLYNTGSDWSEKIWIFNRSIAERVMKSHPGKHVSMMSYILTASPPKTFKAFPANTRIMLTGTNEEDIAPWRGIDVPGGFTGYIYNWCPNLGTRYTPMRTPGFVEAQAKRLADNKIQSIYRDGPGQLFGLEGPVYYTMGRMFDDPEHNSAKDLMPEFCNAAFGSAASNMRSFYDQLYHAIALYSDHIGTRCDVWSYLPTEGRKRKTVSDPFQLIAFLYTPKLLAALDADLTRSEKLATKDKIKTRLALVRTEFDYVRHLARVVHLYHAFELQPDLSSRDRVLDAVDARNAAIDALYDDRGRNKPSVGWSHVFFPFSGHSAKHLRLAEDGYQEPYANTCLNWDTKAMRSAPWPGKKRLTVTQAKAPVTLDAPEWQAVAPNEMTIVPPLIKAPLKTTLRLLYDKTNLYIRAESELDTGGKSEFTFSKREHELTKQEALDLYLSPQSGQDVSYRFMTAPNPASRYDAVSGIITDVMDPRHGKDDPTWNGEWKNESRIDSKTHRWHILITIPFKTLAIDPPAPGTTWRGNFARYHLMPHDKMDRFIWSSAIGNTSMDDRSLFGEIVFE